MTTLLRFYRKAYNELFSGVTEQEPESSTKSFFGLPVELIWH
jgi:hypothetical protein